MIFTSPVFICFFVVTYCLYLLARKERPRQWVLLLASFVFYGWWDYRFLALLGGDILIAYSGASLIVRYPAKRRFFVTLSAGLLLSSLFVFKYCNFALQAFSGFLDTFGFSPSIPLSRIILPVGISFYVFQAISYLVDIYREKLETQSLFNVALYISFFPQLVAGPIVRATDFFPQLGRRAFNHGRQLKGITEFVTGFLYKSVLADNLALLSDPIFADLDRYDNLSVLAASVSFYSQIYFDFAGYSLMAIGVARILGFDFRDNFNYPYRAVSVSDFWHRWHISLSTWLRDYLYIPLGGNRNGRFNHYRNLMLTMLLGGLWHGASWNFVIWGGLHGSGLVLGKAFERLKLSAGIRRGAPFTVGVLLILSWLATQLFVFLCWIPFRLQAFPDTLKALSAVLNIRDDQNLAGADINWGFLLLPVLADTALSWLKPGRGLEIYCRWMQDRFASAVLIVFLALIFSLLLVFVPLKIVPFLYFQF